MCVKLVKVEYFPIEYEQSFQINNDKRHIRLANNETLIHGISWEISSRMHCGVLK